MTARRIGWMLWIVAGVICAYLVNRGLGIRGHRPPQVARAQTDTWTTDAARRQGVRLLDTRDASGPPAYPVQAGDLLFFTNVGTSYGGTNPRNSVVVINARTKKPIAISDIEPGWSENFGSHGLGVSPDARYVYLPAIAPSGSDKPGSILVLDGRTLKIHQIIGASADRAHHVKIFEDWTGKPRMLVEDFNWVNMINPNRNPPGLGGFYILDQTDDNKVVAGMTPGQFRANPYAGFTAPDGRYLYFTFAGAPEIRTNYQVQGFLAKIDMQTWRVGQYIPMGRYPIWTVFTSDGRFAWVTQSGDSKVMKIERAAAPGQPDKVVAEVPTGPGPYGARMSLDDKDLWVADKGETLPGQRGTSITIIDAEANTVKRTIQTRCITNDHLILSPDGQEMWATCNQSHEIVVLDTKTYEMKARIPMPNQGDTHGGSFVAYTAGPGGIVAETVSDQNGLHGSAREAARRRAGMVAGGRE
jgi:DNA-binding beta-propeller fold protein YncE